jgi:N-glycosylase/DNA lyase
MQSLVKLVNDLKNSEVREILENRMKEFSYFRNKGTNEEIFLELCFCFMTANFQAGKSWEIQKELGNKFWGLDEVGLQQELKRLGHRFWPQRGSRIFEVRWLKDSIRSELEKFENELEVREWIVDNLKGLGMKEASHFLRNIGYTDVAIIDKHIINLLVAENLIERPKTVTPKKYLEIENILRELASKTKTNLGELDLYLWYRQTGKVLK